MKMFISEHLMKVLQLLYVIGCIFPDTVVLGASTKVYGNISESKEILDEEDLKLPDQTAKNVENLPIILKTPNDCLTPSKVAGYCVDIKHCPVLLNQLNNSSARDFLRSSKCDSENENFSNPSVCCEKPGNRNSTSSRRPKLINGNVVKKNVDHNNVLPKECGHHEIDLRGRIFGGEKARIGEFPWMARLIHKNKKGKTNFGCSGFLIHSKFVLTAGHCVHKKFTVLRGPVFSVVLGEHNTKTKIDCDNGNCTGPLSIRRVAEVIIHEDYDPEHETAHYNDIALIRLKSGAKMSKYVKPVCLNRDATYIPTDYTLSGWGKTETETVSSIKMKVSLPVVDKSDCSDQFSFLNVTLRETQICAGGKDGKDSCNGDSGGPLMFVGENNSWYATGIVSFGVGCGVDDWPGVYTNIPYFITWIQDKIHERKATKAAGGTSKN